MEKVGKDGQKMMVAAPKTGMNWFSKEQANLPS